MLLIFVLFFIFTILLSGITTIPFVVSLLAVSTVLFKKPWVFFAAFGLGIFLDLLNLRNIGNTSLIFVIFVFVIWLYERKFETQTGVFVFASSFLGSAFYLGIFGYQQILLQSLVSAVVGVFLFNLFRRVMLNSFQHLNLEN